MKKSCITSGPGLQVIKLEFILRLKIKRNDWLLVGDRKSAIEIMCGSSFVHAKYFW